MARALHHSRTHDEALIDAGTANGIRPRFARRLFEAGALLASGVTVACTEPAPNHFGTVVTDSAGIEIAYTQIGEAAPRCSLPSEVVRIGSVAGDSAYELFNVRDAVWLHDGGFAVLNAGSSQIKVFDAKGLLVREFGRRGAGPGEFRNVWSLSLRADTFVIGEYRPWRFSFYTTEGQFIRAVELSPAIIERPEVDVVLSADNGFLVGERCCTAGEGDGYTDRSVTVSRYAPTGNLMQVIGSFWLSNEGFLDRDVRLVGGPIFGARAAFAGYLGDTLVYAPGRTEQVEFWSGDDRPSRIIRWNARDRRVTGEDVEEWRRRFRATFPGDTSSPQNRTLLEAQLGDQRPVADVFPALEEWDGLVVGRDGSVWVKEFRRPLDIGGHRWFLFDATGAFACQLEVPDRMRVLDAGAGDILAVTRDELDVEYVVGMSFGSPVSAEGQ